MEKEAKKLKKAEKKPQGVAEKKIPKAKNGVKKLEKAEHGVKKTKKA